MMVFHKPIFLSLILPLLLFLSCGNDKTSENQKIEIHPMMAYIDSMPGVELKELPLDHDGFTDEEMSSKNYQIKGKIIGGKDELVVFSELTSQKLVFIDSIRCKGGQFKFEGNGLHKNTITFLTIGGMNPPGIPVVVSNGSKIKVSLSNDKTLNYNIKGGVENDQMLALYRIYRSHDKLLEDFNAEVKKIDPSLAPDSVRTAINKKFKTVNGNRNKEIKAFVTNDEGTLASYFAATFLYSKPNPALLAKAFDQLNKNHADSKYAKELKERLDRIAPLSPGALAPEIELTAVDGSTMKLSDLRGKVVLIDFWASWCGPCRRENPHVKKLYEKYSNKGFEIFGVSLDNNQGKWEAAIKKDGLEWIHVSDLKGWKSKAAGIYDVHSIPHTVLIDADGRIIQTGLRSQQLEIVLQDILG